MYFREIQMIGGTGMRGRKDESKVKVLITSVSLSGRSGLGVGWVPLLMVLASVKQMSPHRPFQVP